MSSDVFSDPPSPFGPTFLSWTQSATIQSSYKTARQTSYMCQWGLFIRVCLTGIWEYSWTVLLTVRVCDVWTCVCCFVFFQRTRWSRRPNTATTRTSLTASPTWREHTHTPDAGGALVRHTQSNILIHTIKVLETERRGLNVQKKNLNIWNKSWFTFHWWYYCMFPCKIKCLPCIAPGSFRWQGVLYANTVTKKSLIYQYIYYMYTFHHSTRSLEDKPSASVPQMEHIWFQVHIPINFSVTFDLSAPLQWWRRPCQRCARCEQRSMRSPGARWIPPQPTSLSGRPASRWNAAPAAATPATWDARQPANSTAQSRYKTRTCFCYILCVKV